MGMPMSRGLSDQQRRILGMGVRVNRAIHRGEVKPTVERVEDGKAWCVHTLPEVTTRAVMRFVHGMQFHDEELRPGGSLFAAHPRYRSLEASASRALRSLNKQGYTWWWP